MRPFTDISSIDEIDQEEYTLLLKIKEFGFLSLIMLLGFSGFSICIDKIYHEGHTHSIDKIIVHDDGQPVAHVPQDIK